MTNTEVNGFDVIAVIDVGSPKAGNLGWAYQGASGQFETGDDVDELIERLSRDLTDKSMALGFEAPLFVPHRDQAMKITGARVGEGNRPWSAGAGAAVTTTGIVVVSYVLSKLRKRCPQAKATMEWQSDPAAPETLFLFEVFVTGGEKGNSHCDDATIALQEFKTQLQQGQFKSAIDEPVVLNLMGASLMRTGWTNSTDVLSQDCLVVKA